THGLPFRMESLLFQLPLRADAWRQNATRDALGGLQHVGIGMAESALVLLIAMYLLIYSEELRERFASALPSAWRPHVEQWQDDVNRVLGGFVRGQLIMALAVGVLAAVGCATLGVPFWLLIGMFVVLATLIPVFGPFIGAIPAVLAALLGPPGWLSPL